MLTITEPSTFFDATIKANSNNFTLNIYVPGFDGRHKGDFITIRGDQIDEYIDSYKLAFKRYEELKSMNLNCAVEDNVGKLTVAVRQDNEGVSLQYRHRYRVRTSADLEKALTALEHSKVRGRELVLAAIKLSS